MRLFLRDVAKLFV